MHLRRLCTTSLFLLVSISNFAAAQFPQNYSSSIFQGNQEGVTGTSNYRIPSMVTAPNGDLLAFTEARRNGSDPGAAGFPIDMVVKRSTDGGQTWSNYTVLHSNNNFDYSDPRPIVDSSSGNVHLLYTQWPDGNGQNGVPVADPTSNTSSVIFQQTSTDNGQTWSGPININTQVKDPAWRVLNSGPGIGIQLQWQTNASLNGRLISPSHNFASATASARPIGVFSDDAGSSWQAGTATTGVTANESDIVELTNGDLLLDARVNSGRSGQRNRQQWTSSDGGSSWTQRLEGTDYTSIPVTTVDTGIIRGTAARSGDDRDRIFMSAPLGSTLGNGNSRNNIGIWSSYDEGKTFINPIQLDAGHAGYSSLIEQNDGSFGLIYEETGNTHIRYINFEVSDLEGQTHQQATSHYDGFGNSVARNNSGIGWSGSWSGDGTFSNTNQTAFGGGSSVSFSGFKFQQQDGRLDLNASNDSEVVRRFAAPIDMSTNSTTYISLLVSQVLDTSADNNSEEFLDIELRDGNNVTEVAFGVGSSESFFVTRLGDATATAADTLLRSENYFLVAKIVSSDNSAGSFDQIFLSVMASGDAIPDSDVGLTWTLVGTTNENLDSVLETISIEGGNNALWSVDELRIGSTWGSVASNVAAVPEPCSSSFLALAASLIPLGRRRNPKSVSIK